MRRAPLHQTMAEAEELPSVPVQMVGVGGGLQWVVGRSNRVVAAMRLKQLHVYVQVLVLGLGLVQVVLVLVLVLVLRARARVLVYGRVRGGVQPQDPEPSLQKPRHLLVVVAEKVRYCRMQTQSEVLVSGVRQMVAHGQ